jgi:hypothetical protein
MCGADGDGGEAGATDTAFSTVFSTCDDGGGSVQGLAHGTTRPHWTLSCAGPGGTQNSSVAIGRGRLRGKRGKWGRWGRWGRRAAAARALPAGALYAVRARRGRGQACTCTCTIYGTCRHVQCTTAAPTSAASAMRDAYARPGDWPPAQRRFLVSPAQQVVDALAVPDRQHRPPPMFP